MIDIVVPVYNEGGNIEKLLGRVRDSIKTEKELIVVYDFEEDSTLPVLRKIASDYPFPIRMEKNLFGRGALNAIVTGFRKSSHEAVLVIMADLSDSLEVVDTMYQKMSAEGYDLVCGSRYMKGGKQNGGPFLKGLFSRTAGLTLHWLTGIPTHDISNSFKLYRKSLLDSMTIESNGGFEVGMEILVKAFLGNYRITEVPSQWFDRDEGKSNFKLWKWIPHYLHWYWFCIRHSWFRAGKRK